MLYEMIGTVKAVKDVMTFQSGFTKREFILTREDERFNPDVSLSFTKERCALLDGVQPGERVKVSFAINCREYNGRYYTDLNALKLEKVDETGGAAADTDFPVDSGVPVSGGDDAMPF